MDELLARGTAFPDYTRCHDNDGDQKVDLADDECEALYQPGECGQGAATAMLIPPFLWPPRTAVDDSTKRKRHSSGTGLEMLCDVLTFWPTSVGSSDLRGSCNFAEGQRCFSICRVAPSLPD